MCVHIQTTLNLYTYVCTRDYTSIHIYTHVHKHIILLKICTRTLEYFFKCTYVNKFNLEATCARLRMHMCTKCSVRMSVCPSVSFCLICFGAYLAAGGLHFGLCHYLFETCTCLSNFQIWRKAVLRQKG